MPPQNSSFWTTLPGILTGLGSLIVAITGLLVAWPRLSSQNNNRRETIIVRASEFVRPLNVALGGPRGSNYGDDVLLNGPPYTHQPNAAEFDFSARGEGNYLLKIEYASGDDIRPAKIILNRSMAIESAMAAATGCWEHTCQRTLNQGKVYLRDGANVMRVERSDMIPHIRKFIFEPVD